MLEEMQTPEARAGMQKAFAASPEELGEAALRAAKKTQSINFGTPPKNRKGIINEIVARRNGVDDETPEV